MISSQNLIIGLSVKNYPNNLAENGPGTNFWALNHEFTTTDLTKKSTFVVSLSRLF